jgi:hypothetical protein
MRFDDPICPVCDRPVLPDDLVVKAGQDITHVGCLPSSRKRQLGSAPGDIAAYRTTD